jgi:FlaA1/EpsC-like NDP-sugar epimerase
MDKMCNSSNELMLDADEDFVAKVLRVTDYKSDINAHVILSGIESIVRNCNRVAIYGAGKVGSLMLNFLSSCNLKDRIECFLVSKTYGSNNNIQGIQVVSLDEYENIDTTVFLCVMDYAARREIMINLQKKGMINVELCDENMFLALEKFSL